MDHSTDAVLNVETEFIVFVVVIIFFILFVLFINFYLPFKAERNYLKMEMARSFEEEEYLYWKNKLKMLYIRKIPIVGSIVRRKYNQ